MISAVAVKTKIDTVVKAAPHNLKPGICELAADEDSVMKNQTKVDKSIHIIPGTENGVQRSSTRITSSEVNSEFRILIGLKNVTDATGDAGQDLMKLYREAVADALMGYIPPGADKPLTFASGSPLEFKNGFYWQVDTYSAAYNLRGTNHG